MRIKRAKNMQLHKFTCSPHSKVSNLPLGFEACALDQAVLLQSFTRGSLQVLSDRSKEFKLGFLLGLL
jgi:hypothetical protein